MIYIWWPISNFYFLLSSSLSLSLNERSESLRMGKGPKGDFLKSSDACFENIGGGCGIQPGWWQ
jgi:hypothetical protein